MRIFCNDERSPPTGEWHVVRDTTVFPAAIRSYRPTTIAFDYGLGSDGAGFALPSGQRCMHLLIDEAIDRPADSLYSGWSCCTAPIPLAVRTCVACWRVGLCTAFSYRLALSIYR
jgi:hypothetical protein